MDVVQTKNYFICINAKFSIRKLVGYYEIESNGKFIPQNNKKYIPQNAWLHPHKHLT